MYCTYEREKRLRFPNFNAAYESVCDLCLSRIFVSHMKAEIGH